MAIKVGVMESLFQQGLSFVDLMPYAEYKDGVFINADGSLGKLWQITPWEAEARSDKFLDDLCTQAQDLLLRIPSDRFACQFILKSDSDISDPLKMYSQYSEGASRCDLFAQGRVGFLEEAKGGFWSKDASGYAPRRIKVFLTFRFFPKWVHPSVVDKAFEFLYPEKIVQDKLEQQWQVHKEEFLGFVSVIDGLLKSSALRSVHLDDSELANLIYPILNPKRKELVNTIELNPELILRDQLLFNSPLACGNGFEFEGISYQVVTLKELPLETKIGMLTREFIEATAFCLLDASVNLMMVININAPSKQKAMGHLNLHKGFAFMHKDNLLGDKNVEALEQKNELDQVISQLHKSGQRIVHARVHFIVSHGSASLASQAADQVVNLLSRHHAQAMKEDLIGASLFLTALPLNYDPYYEHFIKRAKRMTSLNASDLLPLFGSLQGTKTPAQMYLNRRGEIVFLDFFDSQINPHGVVVGASGAGKSFFMNDFIVQNERMGAHFFVLDKGDSYRKLNQVLGGQYMSFDLNAPVTINPFINKPTPENLSFLMSLLGQMASGSDERDRLNREEEGLLQKAVLQTYESIREREIVLSDVVALLNDNAFNEEHGINSLMGPTLALRLTPFTKKGPYGGFFDGPNAFNINGHFTVFELANLSSYGDLQVVVLLNLMFFMTNFVAQAHMRPLRKFLLIDEAWSLLKVRNTSEFITNAFKTFRKYRCSVVAITQEMADLTRCESGVAIVANASNKLFLKQEPALIDLLQDKLSLSAETIALLKTLQTKKGQFSEALIITDSALGVLRLVPDPYLYWAANSEARNNDYLWKRVDQCNGDIMRAIDLCAKEYPYGLK